MLILQKIILKSMILKIVILSDTHIRGNFKLNHQLQIDLDSSDAVIHCGDFQSREFYNYLNSNYNLFCARGNTDFSLPDSVRDIERFKLGNFVFIVTHSHKLNPHFLHLKFPDANIICYGHTHHPEISKNNDKEQLILNPGSYDFNRAVDFESYLKMELTDEFSDIKVELVKIL